MLHPFAATCASKAVCSFWSDMCNTKLIILSLILTLFGGIFAAGQAVRATPDPFRKANTRPAAPTPTPADPATAASSDPNITDGGEVISVTTQVVSLPVRVMDKKGRFVAGLTKDDFVITENGQQQDIAMFANESEPFTVALVLDMSYSTTFKLQEIQSAAIEFIEQLRPRDKVMVVSFDGEVHLLCDATGDRSVIHKAILATKIDTGTSLYEAVDTVMNQRLRKIAGRKAMILFTDGVDTTSRRVNELSNLTDALEMDALIYPIRYDTFADVQAMKNRPSGPPPITIPASGDGGVLQQVLKGVPTAGGPGTTAEDYERAEKYLSDLAMRTGGRIYQAQTIGNLSEAYKKIASELREFYSIGYYPKVERVANQQANVKVKVSRPGLVVRSRETFIGRRNPRNVR